MNRTSLITKFLERNDRLNLSAIRTADGVMTKHILDSIELTKVIPLINGKTLLDVGTGGGFPLLPLAMLYPCVACTGLDATKKKCVAVQTIANEI